MKTAALILLLAAAAARCHLGETSYRSSAVRGALAAGQASVEPAAGEHLALARVSFAVLLLTAGAVWLGSCAAEGRLVVRHLLPGMLLVVFAALSLLSAKYACDKRTAWTGWLEMLTILGSAWLAAQLCRRREHFALVVVVLTAIGLAMTCRGLWEYFIEVPQRVADFEQHKAERLAQAGLPPGSPQALAFEARYRSTVPLGYSGLSNIFASLLLVTLLAGAGLAAAKVASARAARAAKPPKPGHVSLPTVAAMLTTALIAATAAVLLLTRSLGAAVSAAAALAALGLVATFRGFLARHRRGAVGFVLLCVLAGSAALVWYGQKHDRLPSRTMTFRWHYWTGAAEIVKDHPLLGVGPGNFSAAYLEHRRASAEEAVKMPHNLVMHALAEYGLPGGLVLLAILLYFAVAATRPEQSGDDPPSTPGASQPHPEGLRRLLLVTGAAVVAATVLAALWFGYSAESAAFTAINLAVEAFVLALALLLAAWCGGENLVAVTSRPICRIALACGAAGFLLHNAVEMSLWMPATGLVFALTVGAALARAESPEASLTPLRWLFAAAGVAGIITAIIVFWQPVFHRTILSDRALAALSQGPSDSTMKLFDAAADADGLDPVPAAEASDAWRAAFLASGGEDRLYRSVRWALEAVYRDPCDPSWHRRAGETFWLLTLDDEQRNDWLRHGALRPGDFAREGVYMRAALEQMDQAVQHDPQDLRQRVLYARMLLSAGRRDDARDQLQRALAINDQLEPQSFWRFSTEELNEIRDLQRTAAAP